MEEKLGAKRIVDIHNFISTTLDYSGQQWEFQGWYYLTAERIAVLVLFIQTNQICSYILDDRNHLVGVGEYASSLGL
jgi:hypothetical protein